MDHIQVWDRIIWLGDAGKALACCHGNETSLSIFPMGTEQKLFHRHLLVVCVMMINGILRKMKPNRLSPSLNGPQKKFSKRPQDGVTGASPYGTVSDGPVAHVRTMWYPSSHLSRDFFNALSLLTRTNQKRPARHVTPSKRRWSSTNTRL